LVGVKGGRTRQRKLAQKLRIIRESLGLSQGQLVKEFGLERLTRGNISMYELGEREPPIYVLLAYGKAANICMDTLLDDAFDLPPTIPVKGKRHTPRG
jgi:transcriptional regulator with XRE-family HTH domain